MLEYWIWLAQLNHISPLWKCRLLARFSTAQALYAASEAELRQLEGITPSILAVLSRKDLEPARTIHRRCQAAGIGILTAQDAAYPARLKNTADAPVVLYYRGSLPSWEAQPVIGVVGTRKASAYGNAMAACFGGQIAACGALVVSGGAAGVDTQAMAAALEAGMPVVGVLGCGVDVAYPAENRALFDRVAENGCLLSEYPPQAKGLSWHFPARNRIITGLSHGVLVVEAPHKSGAMISARYALDQGRDLFVVPGNVDSASCAGSNSLLQEGALAVFNGWDVVKEYAPRWPQQVKKPARLPVSKPVESKASAGKTGKKPIDKEEKSTYSVLNSEQPHLSDQERAVLALLGKEPVPMDLLLSQTAMDTGTVKRILTRLTLLGLVVNGSGGRISLK